MLTGFNWLVIGVQGSCEHRNESSGYTDGGKYVNQLNNYHFLKKDWLHGYSKHIYS